MRRYADLHGDKRMFLGAAAGMVATANVKEYALKQGGNLRRFAARWMIREKVLILPRDR